MARVSLTRPTRLIAAGVAFNAAVARPVSPVTAGARRDRHTAMAFVSLTRSTRPIAAGVASRAAPPRIALRVNALARLDCSNVERPA